MQKEKKGPIGAERAQHRHRLTDLLDIPTECVMSTAVVQICGDEVSVTGACCLLECNESLVLIKARGGQVRIEGEGLELQDFVQDRVTVRGEIRVVYPPDERQRREI